MHFYISSDFTDSQMKAIHIYCTLLKCHFEEMMHLQHTYNSKNPFKSHVILIQYLLGLIHVQRKSKRKI